MQSQFPQKIYFFGTDNKEHFNGTDLICEWSRKVQNRTQKVVMSGETGSDVIHPPLSTPTISQTEHNRTPLVMWILDNWGLDHTSYINMALGWHCPTEIPNLLDNNVCPPLILTKAIESQWGLIVSVWLCVWKSCLLFLPIGYCPK